MSKKVAKLLALNRSELVLEQSAAQADLTRYQRESEKARAAKNLAEMRIADALALQAQARLDLVQYRLENATVKSAFDGIVVEGDLRERIAAPVKQGDALFKVARLDTLYAEAEIPERDVKEILRKCQGRNRVCHATQAEISRVDPDDRAGGSDEKGRKCFSRPPEIGPRRGIMVASGHDRLVQIVRREDEALFWILTHRTVDFLRMKLWW